MRALFVPVLVLLAGLAMPARAAEPVTVADFGGNPGRLEMRLLAPARSAAPLPLVVLLHGCRQDASAFARDSGWAALAEAHRFVLLLPQQTEANNPYRCFRWFEILQNARGRGEAFSIRQMIEKVQATHAIDPQRVFVTGLSAGGAMAVALLAGYPEVFAAGAIVAGVPFGCASNLSEALPCMRDAHPGAASWTGWFCGYAPWLCPAGAGGGALTAAEWGGRVRDASPHRGPFPRVSIWQGAADDVVRPVNAEALVRQWTDLHRLPEAPSTTAGNHREWKDAAGAVRVESWTIPAMAHGQPVDPGSGPAQCGAAAAFVLDVDLCASRRIARFFGLVE